MLGLRNLMVARDLGGKKGSVGEKLQVVLIPTGLSIFQGCLCIIRGILECV